MLAVCPLYHSFPLSLLCGVTNLGELGGGSYMVTFLDYPTSGFMTRNLGLI